MSLIDRQTAALVERAKSVLSGNWTGRATRPSPHLYPHQWNWDSGFVAIGLARFDQARAQRELSSLFEAQWGNGMVPQIVFDPESLGNYFPEPDFWQCERSVYYPRGRLTSGITMPPVHAITARRIVEHAVDREAALAWLAGIYPKIVALHEYLYRDRDPASEGLVFIRHPWESGLDNSPLWDPALHAMTIDKATLPPYRRRDLDKGVPESQRPTDEDYDRYVFLADLFRRRAYDERAILDECPFLLQDPLFNALLCKADEDLAVLGGLLGEDTQRIEEWAERTRRAMRDKLFHPGHGAFDAFDLRAGRKVEALTASSFVPLVCGAPTAEQAAGMYAQLDSHSFCPIHDTSCFSIPNYALGGASFDRSGYWRGPVWINTNWLLMHGLRRYGFADKAAAVRQDIIELVRRWGFFEYFDPYDGTGYGSDNFSWTAALFIDVVLDAPVE